MSRICVLGGGSWGTTLAILLSENDHDVTLWVWPDAQAQEMLRTRRNETFLPGIDIPESIRISGDIAESVAEKNIIVVSVPTHALRATMEQAASHLQRGALLVITSKGLEEGTLDRMSEVVAEATGAEASRILSLLGPSHAEEVSRKIPTSIVVAGTDAASCEEVQHVFSRPYFRVYTNDDVVGVEIGTALKNPIAIAAGIIDGLGFGDNTKAALITRGLAEIRRLGVALGGRPETFSGLAGVGDLVVTCLSRHSRNRYVGEAIGGGKTLEEALAGMTMVAEGVRTTRAAVELGRRSDIELPIIEMVQQVLFDGRDPREAVGQLMTRPLRQEPEDAAESERS